MSTNVSGDEYLEGNVLITEGGLSTPMEDNASMSGSMQGTGPLTMATES